MKQTIWDKDIAFLSHPWFLFVVFLATNCLLAFSGAGIEDKLWTFLVGLALPFGLAAFSTRPFSAAKAGGLFSTEAFLIPPRLLGLLLVIACALRFWDLTGLFCWPNWDEAAMGIFASELARHWEWNYFFGFGEEPPSFIWATALLLKLGLPPLLSLWLPPALVSAAGVGMAWTAARQFFSRSLSFLLAGLVGLAYTTLLLGRLGLPLAWMPLWEGLLFYLWGRYKKASGKGPGLRRKWIFLFGLASGFGFNLTHFWIAAAGLMLAFGWGLLKEKQKTPDFLVAASGFALGIFPFLTACLTQGYGGDVAHISFLQATNWRPLEILGAYFSAYCWGFPWDAYVPHGMGFWNPLLDSFFFLGLLEWIRLRNNPLARGFFLLLALLYLPVGLVVGLDPFRLLQVLPLWLLAMATGLLSLLNALPKNRRLAVALVALALCGLLDITRLVLPYRDVPARPMGLAEVDKSPEKFRAFQILKEQEAREGPGLVLTEMVPESGDFSLAYAAPSWNAAWAPEENLEKAKWVALVTPFHYSSYFGKAYPDCRIWTLPSRVPDIPSDHELVLLPVTPQNLPVLRQWWKAYQWFWRLSYQVLAAPNGLSRRPVLRELLAAYPGLPPDPYLQACFFEKLLFNYSAERTFHPEDDWVRGADFSKAFDASFNLACKDAVIDVKRGRLLELEGRDGEALKAYQEALQVAPADPLIRERIRQLSLPPGQRDRAD